MTRVESVIPAALHALWLIAYRPSGRHHRSNRANNDNDVFEGLPVKQWGHVTGHVSLAPPKPEVETLQQDRWADPPLPRDTSLLLPWTQELLRLARSGKVGTKRKHDADPQDDEKPEEDSVEEPKPSAEDRGYVAKRWKQLPEAMLQPEHRHLEYLAPRRKGLPSLYGPDAQVAPIVTMRRTRVQRTAADGEVAIYEVLVPEGQAVEGEVREPGVLADMAPVAAVPGTVIEGVGVANDQGVLVAEHLKPSVAPRRNRPPPKKKGGPGRGKKRVTFTNPDGSTYTTVVPNATKIVPRPGQTVKHVAKGEEATADVTAEQAAATAATNDTDQQNGGDDGEEGDDDGDDDGDEDDDDEQGSEDGEIPEDAPTGMKPRAEESSSAVAAEAEVVKEEQDTTLSDPATTQLSEAPQPTLTDLPTEPPVEGEAKRREGSSSPDLPLVRSRQGSTIEPSTLKIETKESLNAVETATAITDPTVAEVAEQSAESGGITTQEITEVDPAPAQASTEPVVSTASTNDSDVTGAAGEKTAMEPALAESGGGNDYVRFEEGSEGLSGSREKSLDVPKDEVLPGQQSNDAGVTANDTTEAPPEQPQTETAVPEPDEQKEDAAVKDAEEDANEKLNANHEEKEAL